MVLSPSGPPWRIAQTCANTLKSQITERNVVSMTSGRIDGHDTVVKDCHEVAPSMAAASYCSLGACSRPA